MLTLNIRSQLLALLVAAVFKSGILCAEPVWQPDYVGIGAAYTTDARAGINIEAGWQLNADWRFSARLERGFYEREHTVRFVDFAESFQRNSLGLFASRSILAVKGLSLTAGVMHFDKASTWIANPKADAVYQLNGRYYSGLNLGKPEATVSYRDLIPYLGVSWSSLPPGKTGWGFKFEAGALFNLDPDLTIQSDNPSGLALLNADLQHEADDYVRRLRANDEFLESTAPRIGVTAIYQF